LFLNFLKIFFELAVAEQQCVRSFSTISEGHAGSFRSFGVLFFIIFLISFLLAAAEQQRVRGLDYY
jgi:hypothetical protein